jgi:hypothetical protein
LGFAYDCALILHTHNPILPHAFADGEIVHLVPIVDVAAEGGVHALITEVAQNIGIDVGGVDLSFGV